MMCKVCGGRTFVHGREWEYPIDGKMFLEWEKECVKCGHPNLMGPREVLKMENRNDSTRSEAT